MIRTLVIPNITYGGKGQDLMKDSYVDFLYKFLLGMKKERQDIFWYILLPKYDKTYANQVSAAKKKLQFPNTGFFEIEIPRQPYNRIHFNVNELYDKVFKSRRFGVDLIFNHQPELGYQWSVLMKQKTHWGRAPMIGYSHFFEFKSTKWYGNINNNINGILEMEVCYLNTKEQKQIVLEEASETFNSDIIKKLDKKLKVFPPITFPQDVRTSKDGVYEKVIVWNHRTDPTKSFEFFIGATEDLWRQRKDFKVWIPLLPPSSGMSKCPYVITGQNETKRKYFDGLRKCCVGVNGEQNYGGWSIATDDGNKCGVPYVMFDAPYYKELNDGADFYKNRKELVGLLNKYLNEPSYRNQMAEQTIENLILNRNVDKKIKQVSRKIDTLMKQMKPTHTDLTDKMIDIIKSEGEISSNKLFSSKFMTIGGQVVLSGHRKTILNTDGISERQLSKKKGFRGGKIWEWESIYKFDGSSKNVSIPLMMTRKMRKELTVLGYSEKDIKLFKPKEAHEIINMGTKKS